MWHPTKIGCAKLPSFFEAKFISYITNWNKHILKCHFRSGAPKFHRHLWYQYMYADSNIGDCEITYYFRGHLIVCDFTDPHIWLHIDIRDVCEIWVPPTWFRSLVLKLSGPTPIFDSIWSQGPSYSNPCVQLLNYNQFTVKDYRYHDFPNTEFSYFLTIDTRQ